MRRIRNPVPPGKSSSLASLAPIIIHHHPSSVTVRWDGRRREAVCRANSAAPTCTAPTAHSHTRPPTHPLAVSRAAMPVPDLTPWPSPPSALCSAPRHASLRTTLVTLLVTLLLSSSTCLPPTYDPTLLVSDKPCIRRNVGEGACLRSLRPWCLLSMHLRCMSCIFLNCFWPSLTVPS